MIDIDILGTKYTVDFLGKEADPLLNERDGYCDWTSRRIVVVTKPNDCEIDDFDAYQRKCLRHEIIHAFLCESGLHENWTHEDGHDETYVDWLAAQYPKIKEAFVMAGCDEKGTSHGKAEMDVGEAK